MIGSMGSEFKSTFQSWW